MSRPIAVEDKASAIGTLKAGDAHHIGRSAPFSCRLRRNHKGVREFSWLNDADFIGNDSGSLDHRRRCICV